MSLSREQFFRDLLIPTGTVVELFMLTARERGLNKKYGGRAGTLLWEPLNLLSCYLLAKQEPSPTTLDVLERNVLAISAHVREWLKEMTTRRVASYDFMHGQLSPEKMQELLSPAILSIYAELLYDTRYPDKWFAEYQSRMYTFGTRDSMAAWRTFARNLEPERTVTALKLPAVYKAAAKRLTSKQGVQRVMTLWYQCFPVERTPDVPAKQVAKDDAPVKPDTLVAGNTPEPVVTEQTVTPAQAEGKVDAPATAPAQVWTEETFPTFVSVSSSASGMLEISATFDPAIPVKLRTELKNPLPVAMRKRFAKRSKVVTCAYRDLARAVDEITLWYREECLVAAQLQEDYTAWADSFLSKDLLERLRKTFTEAEIPLLLREMTREQKGPEPDANIN
jgi:hypothetical protein